MNIDKIIESLNGVYTESNIRKVLAEEVSNEKSNYSLEDLKTSKLNLYDKFSKDLINKSKSLFDSSSITEIVLIAEESEDSFGPIGECCKFTYKDHLFVVQPSDMPFSINDFEDYYEVGDHEILTEEFMNEILPQIHDILETFYDKCFIQIDLGISINDIIFKNEKI